MTTNPTYYTTITSHFPTYTPNVSEYFVSPVDMAPRPITSLNEDDGVLAEDASYTSSLIVNAPIPFDIVGITDEHFFAGWSALYLLITLNGNKHMVPVTMQFTLSDTWIDVCKHPDTYTHAINISIRQDTATVNGEQVFLNTELPGPLRYENNLWYILLTTDVNVIIDREARTLEFQVNALNALTEDNTLIPFEAGQVVGFQLVTVR